MSSDSVGVLKFELTTDNAKFSKGLGDAEKQVRSFGDIARDTIISTIAQKGFETVVGAAQKATSAITSAIKSSVQAYADYEQLAGGVETLFKESADTIFDYATVAYETAGVSANQYMETVTSFSASLLQGLGGDTAQAAEIANMAMVDMSDNANKMGTDFAAIQNAYQGFAKQNYTMLDNLKLGYGGTASEMARLINDSGVLGDTMTVTAKTVNDVSFDKMIEAIHKVQDNIGITGTTSEEAATTISGSLNAVKASWQNLLTFMGGGTTMAWDDVFPALVNSVKTFAQNVIPVLGDVLFNVGELIGEIATIISAELPGLISTLTPMIIQAATSIVMSLAKALPGIIKSLVGAIVDTLPTITKSIAQALPEILKSLVDAVMQLAIMLTEPENLQMMLQAGLELLLALVEAIPEVITAIVDALPQIIDNIITFLTDPSTLEMLIRAAVQLFMGLVEAIPRVLGALIGAVGNLIGSLISHIGSFIPEMIGMAIQLGSEFLNNVISFFQQLPGKIGEFLSGVIEKLVTWVPQMVENAVQAGQQFLQNIINFFQQLPGKIWEFLTQTISNVINFVTDFIGKAIQAGKDFFDGLVNKVMEIPGKMLEIGGNIVKGIWEGISGAAGWLWDQVAGFCSGIVDGIKDFFGIHSPSTLFRDEVGIFMAQGIGVGFSEEMTSVNGEMQAVLAENMPSATMDATMSVNADMNNSFFSTEEQRAAYIEAMTEFYQQLDELQTNTATKLTTNINNWVMQTQNKIQEFTKNSMDKITQFGNQLVQKASELSKSFHDKILEHMNKLPNEFNQLGVNIIKGLESGMRAQEPTLMAYVDSLCAKIVAKMQAAMKIHSPSQVMRDQIGVYLAQGVGVGFAEEMEKVNDEMASSITIAEPDTARIDQWIDIDFEDEGTASDRPLTVYMENNIDSDLDIEQVGDQLLEQMRRI